MKKLFLAICFSCLIPSLTQAKIKQVFDVNAVPQAQNMKQNHTPQLHNVTIDEFEDFLQNRITQTVIEDADKINTNAFHAVPSERTNALMKQQKKSEFEKIYDQAMQRIRNKEQAQNQRNDIQIQQENANPSDLPSTMMQELNSPNIPMINVTLPVNDIKVTAPALEHIPYLRSDLEVLPDGTLKIEETVVVVADGNKLKGGLTKPLPKYAFAMDNSRTKIDYSIIDVQINGQEFPYKITEGENAFYMVPKAGQILESGVYTYTFHYLAHHILTSSEDIKNLYWDVTGSSWNLVISRVAATITLPPAISNIGLEIFSGRPSYFRKDLTQIYKIGANRIGIISLLPVFPGNGLHIVLSLPADKLIQPDFSDKFLLFFDRHGDVLISLLALLVIAVSFKISWKYIRKNKGQLNIKLKKNAPLLRYLAFNCFDLTSFGSFLLELYRKNIIDIQNADGRVLLIKKTDRLNALEKHERLALKQLFVKDDTIFNAGKANFLKIKRAASFIKKDLRRSLALYMLKMNSGYLFFSLGMLLIAEAYIAALQTNVFRTFAFLSVMTIVLFLATSLFCKKTTLKWLAIFTKLGAVLLIVPAFLIMSAFIHPAGVLFIFLSVIIIRRFMSVYSQRNAALAEPIADALALKKEFSETEQTHLQGREIMLQQPRIFALGQAERFADKISVNEYNKLQAMLDFLALHKNAKL